MKVTLKDIARDTGYSISTISRVLNNVGNISGKAREKILQSAEKLNYPVSKIKGYDRSKGRLNIALITDFHEGEFYASYFFGFLKSANKENIRLSLLSVMNPKKEIKKFMTELLNEEYYDGAILFMPELDRIEYENLKKVIPESFPIVSNAMIENHLFSTITFDGYSGGHQAASHFYEMGYHRVGIVKGPANKAESRFRYNGFKDFINKQPEMNLLWEFEGDFEFDSGVQSFNDFYNSRLDLDAVFISNDLMATAFIDSAISENFQIPEDIAILAYDDLPMCKHSKPRISSINTDFERLGTTTIRMLKNRFSDNSPQHGILSLIPVNISVRESTSLKSARTEITKKA